MPASTRSSVRDGKSNDIGAESSTALPKRRISRSSTQGKTSSRASSNKESVIIDSTENTCRQTDILNNLSSSGVNLGITRGEESVTETLRELQPMVVSSGEERFQTPSAPSSRGGINPREPVQYDRYASNIDDFQRLGPSKNDGGDERSTWKSQKELPTDQEALSQISQEKGASQSPKTDVRVQQIYRGSSCASRTSQRQSFQLEKELQEVQQQQQEQQQQQQQQQNANRQLMSEVVHSFSDAQNALFKQLDLNLNNYINKNKNNSNNKKNNKKNNNNSNNKNNNKKNKNNMKFK